jgi:hypothetical protein
MRIAIATLLFFLTTATTHAQSSTSDPLAGWLTHVERLVPSDMAKFETTLPAQLTAANDAIEQWAVDRASFRSARSSDDALAVMRQLLDAKRRVDRLLDTTIELRTQAAANADPDTGRDHIRSFLRTCSRLIDLSGRLRYLQNDALQQVASRYAATPSDRARMVELLIQYRSSIGAMVCAPLLNASLNASAEPPRRRIAAASAEREQDALRGRILELIAVSGESSCIGEIVRMLERGDVPPQRALQAAETIRRIGLPQAVRPGTTEDLPAPAVTPARLTSLVSSISASGLSRDERSRLEALRSWLTTRAQEGVTEPAYRLGTYDVRPGDWLLMRNPSPYNLFTDLSPGLFTHVGVVTSERGTDGITRMVIVDLPERGRLMPATNVEIFLQRSLHYVFLRHPDPKVAETMAEAARQTIGNETEFDLNFRTERVLELAHTNLVGRKIQTYCAGMLLLCAVQTDVDRHAFFPLEEYAAGGHTVDNLAKLGMSFAKEFISPTGAMFSPTLSVAGRREPMYEPAREIEESVFDRFATQLVDRPLDPAPELFDSLMVKVAAAASQNALLAGALARAAGVGNDVDLVGAARGSAVVETLDDVAFAASDEFRAAREAVRAVSLNALRQEGLSDEELAVVKSYRDRHADLVRAFAAGQLTPRKLRTTLVTYYTKVGRDEIDHRFFEGSAKNLTAGDAESAEGK